MQETLPRRSGGGFAVSGLGFQSVGRSPAPSPPRAPAERVEPAAPLVEPGGPAIGSLVWRPALRSRNGVGYVTCRSWGAKARKTDLVALKRMKREMPEGPIAGVVADLITVARSFLGLTAAAVVPVACGHSKRLDCLSFRLAHGVADALGADLVQAFRPRFVSGSSHPKENVKLPPLEIAELPKGPALVVDDVATSGFHMEEAIRTLRDRGVPAIGLVWLGGITSG